MNTSEFKTAAQAGYSALLDAAAALRARLDDVKWRTDGAVVGATITALNSADKLMASLAPGGSFTLRVLAGEKSVAQWQAHADGVRSLIDTAARNLGESLPSWKRIQAEIVRPTIAEAVAEVKDGAESIASVVPTKVWFAIGGGVALALVVLAVVYLPKGN